MLVDVPSTSRTMVTPQTIKNILHNANIRKRYIYQLEYLLVKQIGGKDNFANVYISKTLEF